MRRIVLVAAALVLALAAPAQALQGTVESAAQALVSDPVYVHPDAAPKLTAAQADELRQRITAKGAGPMYVAFLPASATAQFGGSIDAALLGLQQRLGRPGTYVLVAGRTFRAGSTDLKSGATAQAANAALNAHSGDIAAILDDFTDRIGDVRAGRSPDSGGGVSAFVPLAFLILVVGGIGLLVTSRIRKQRVEQQRRFDEVHAAVREDVVELGDEIRALGLDVQMADLNEAAKTD